MQKEYELIGKINVTIEGRASARGSGLCLALPKDLALVHNIIAGDHLKFQITDHYRQKPLADPGTQKLKKLKKASKWAPQNQNQKLSIVTAKNAYVSNA